MGDNLFFCVHNRFCLGVISFSVCFLLVILRFHVEKINRNFYSKLL